MKLRCIDPNGGLELWKVYDAELSTNFIGMVVIDWSLWCIERFIPVDESLECKCGIRRADCTYHRGAS
jgi:hypothetical protein